MHHAEFEDPRVVVVYDAESPWSHQDDFFVAVVEEFVPLVMNSDGDGPQILDLGCGTGRLAMGLVAKGYQVTGVDPASASLDIARARQGSERVTWIEGTSSLLPHAAFNAALMTSHVTQFFLTDDVWHKTLSDLHRALTPGSTLTFDTRDPDAREWDSWTKEDSTRKVRLPDGRTVLVWTEVTSDSSELVSFCHHYVYPDASELLSSATLRFRSFEEVRSSLEATGFTVVRAYGGWGREPLGAGDGEFLVTATR